MSFSEVSCDGTLLQGHKGYSSKPISSLSPGSTVKTEDIDSKYTNKELKIVFRDGNWLSPGDAKIDIKHFHNQPFDITVWDRGAWRDPHVEF